MVDAISGIEGGQGLVVRAERRAFGGDPVGYAGAVSLKLLTDVAAERVATLTERWACLSELDHPNLAAALEVFQGPGLSRDPPVDATDDVCYVAARWIEGSGLREIAPLEPDEAFRMARDVAEGVDALHGKGLVHRDLHPGNLIRDESGRFVLIDFGSARHDDGSSTTTVSGVVGFIPPDAVNAPGGAPADRWGLGMLTIFALLGHPQGPMSERQLRQELTTALEDIGQSRPAVELLCQMVDADPSERPVDSRRWAHELTACLIPPSRKRRVLASVAGLTLLTAMVAGSLAVEQSRNPTNPWPERVDAPDCPPPSGAARRSDVLVEQVQRLAADVCPAGAEQLFDEAPYQPLATPSGQPAGVVMVAPGGEAVRLTEAMWTSYQALRGRAAPDAVPHAGYPIAVERWDERDAVVVHFDRSGMLIGPRDDTQLYWIPDQVMGQWEDRGGLSGDLGFPMSNPYRGPQGFHLDFEHGTMHAYGTPEEIAAIVAGGPVEAEVELHPPGPTIQNDTLAAKIIRQANGTNWWLDDDLIRHWIPDTATWNCLGGANQVAQTNLKGWEVAAFPLGAPAECGAD